MSTGWGRGAAAVVLLVVVAGALPGAGPRLTAATWTDTTRARTSLTIGSGACTATGVYTGQASGALLTGSVQGTTVGTGALAPLTTGMRAGASSAVTASTGSAEAAAAGVALSPASSWNLTASTTGTGTSSATAGGPAVGGVDVSGILSRSPDRGSSLPGLSGVGLDVGAITSSSALRGCAAAWGDADALTRSSTVSGLRLRFADSAVASALDALAVRGTATTAALADLAAAQATTDALAAALRNGLVATVGTPATGSLAAPTASATITPAAAAVSGVAATATGLQTSGETSVDVGSRSVAVTLPVPSGPDGDVLPSARLTATTADGGAALRLRAAGLTDAEARVRDDAVLAVHAAVDVLSVAGARVSTVSVDGRAKVSAWQSGQDLGLTVKVQLLGAPQATVDAGLTARALTASLPLVQTALAASFTTPATTAIAADVAWAGPLVDAATTTLGTHLAALPSVLVVTTDQRGTGAGDSWTGSAAAGSGGVSALRVRVNDQLGARADLFFGSTAAGPNLGAFR